MTQNIKRRRRRLITFRGWALHDGWLWSGCSDPKLFMSFSAFLETNKSEIRSNRELSSDLISICNKKKPIRNPNPCQYRVIRNFAWHQHTERAGEEGKPIKFDSNKIDKIIPVKFLPLRAGIFRSRGESEKCLAKLQVMNSPTFHLL